MQACYHSSTRRGLLGAALAVSAVPAAAKSASPIAHLDFAPAVAPPGSFWMSAPNTYRHIFVDLAKRLGVADPMALAPEGEGGEGKILVWVDEAAWRRLVAAARALS